MLHVAIPGFMSQLVEQVKWHRMTAWSIWLSHLRRSSASVPIADR